MQTVVQGIIIREKVSDEDRLLTLLTSERGVIYAVAKGANRARAKLVSSTGLFCYGQFGLFCYKDRYVVDFAEIEDSFTQLRSDLVAIALASYIAEVCCEVVPGEEEAGEYLRLVLNCLYFLKTKAVAPKQLKAIFELRIMAAAGFMPSLVGCVGCGAFEGDGMLFCPENGELYCASCSPKAAAMPVAPGVLAAMRHIVYSEPQKLFSFKLSDESQNALDAVSERYLKFHVQRGFRSLDFYHSVI